jgi:16S rRNA (cytosine967-C5)-methyltransferase
MDHLAMANVGIMKTAREAAYCSLLEASRNNGFIAPFLDAWRQQDRPDPADFNLAQEIAYGSCRMALALDFIGASLTDKGKLNIKLKERILLRTALYQHFYMARIPLYALTNESLEIAKKYCHYSFANFLNAVLRKVAEKVPPLPAGDNTYALSVRYSYPLFFVQQLVADYGLETAKEVLAAQNMPSPTMVRIRPCAMPLKASYEGMEVIEDLPIPMAVVTDGSAIKTIASSPDFYIQNATPALLIDRLRGGSLQPKRILDLCASPGGKLLAAHDCFPEAQLSANDVSEDKLVNLKENIAKYNLKAEVSCSPGETFRGTDLYDLIILDVPCSNSGVLNKRPEARWRLSEDALEAIETVQHRLVSHALDLLAADGEIWYMTCSILNRENEGLIAKICRQHQVDARDMVTILPNPQGLDGGFCCALKRTG